MEIRVRKEKPGKIAVGLPYNPPFIEKIKTMPHLLESGVDLRCILEILDHKSSKTAEIYSHISTKDIGKIKSPLDTLSINLGRGGKEER